MKDITKPEELTPIEEIDGIAFKRDDYFVLNEGRGGKARTLLYYIRKEWAGLTTAGSRNSNQCDIVARVAARFGFSCRIHVPEGKLSPELEQARTEDYTEIVQHKAGYNNVVIKRARDDAEAREWKYIPFGMDMWEMIRTQVSQASNVIDYKPDRIVIPIGSGMAFFGVANALAQMENPIPLVGIAQNDVWGKRVKYAPNGWLNFSEIIKSGVYGKKKKENVFKGIILDKIYEANCIPYLKDGDLLWIVGISRSLVK